MASRTFRSRVCESGAAETRSSERVSSSHLSRFHSKLVISGRKLYLSRTKAAFTSAKSNFTAQFSRAEHCPAKAAFIWGDQHLHNTRSAPQSLSLLGLLAKIKCRRTVYLLPQHRSTDSYHYYQSRRRTSTSSTTTRPAPGEDLQQRKKSREFRPPQRPRCWR